MRRSLPRESQSAERLSYVGDIAPRLAFLATHSPRTTLVRLWNDRVPRRNLQFDFETECSVSKGLMGGRGWRASARNPGASFAPLSPAPATRSIKARVECDRGIGPSRMDIHVRRMAMKPCRSEGCCGLTAVGQGDGVWSVSRT